MAERVLTARELNRALLARQLLLERSPAPLPRVLERIGGLQAQYAPSMYVGLWSRMTEFEREHLDRALERRTVVQGTLMRVTIHLVSAPDYWPFAVGLRHARREWWVKTHKSRPSANELEEAAARLREYLRDGPRRQKEIDEFFGGADPRRMNGVGLFLDLVRAPPSGTWDRRRADLYAAAEDWLGPETATPEQGLDHLVRRYLVGFGPAPVRDVAGWAGLPASDVAAAVRRLSLRRFRSESGDELVDVPRAPLPDPDTPAPVRFLPTWDATLLVHARRTQILPEDYRPLVFNTRTPHSVATFLVDGRVAGTWSHGRGRIVTSPFVRLPAAASRELEAEADRLATLHS